MTATRKPVTAPQVDYIDRLRPQVPEGDPLHAQADDVAALDMAQASDLIDRMKSAAKANRPARPEPEQGLYMVDGTVYRVQPARESGRLYAKRLDPDTGWQYEGKRPFAFLSADQRMTVEQAEAFGVAHGCCAVCGRTLTVPESVERGLGPVCAGRL